MRKMSLTMLFLLFNTVFFAQGVNRSPIFSEFDVDSIEHDLQGMNDTLVIVITTRTYNLYSKKQVLDLKRWVEISDVIEKPMEYWVISNETSTIMKEWRDSFFSDETGGFYFFGEDDKAFNRNLEIVPTVFFCHDSLTIIKSEGFKDINDIDNEYLMCLEKIDSLEKLERRNFSRHREEKNFHIYPNPSKGVFSIKAINTNNVINKITVFDILGRKIKESVFPMDPQLIIKGYAPGTYFIKIEYNGRNEEIIQHTFIR